MANMQDNIWIHVPGLLERLEQYLARGYGKRKVRRLLSEEFNLDLTLSTIGCKIQRMKAGAIIPKGPPARIPSPLITMQDAGIVEKVRKLLLKDVASVADIADRIDVAPKRVRAAIDALSQAGFNVAIHEGDGANAKFMVETGSAPAKTQVQIKAEKYYGDVETFEFGAVADTHLGSKFFRPEVLNALYDVFAQEGIKHVFHGGNYIEGEKHDKFGLLVHGMQGQIDYFIDKYPQREGITTYFVAGDDHEGWYQQREGIDIGRFTESEARSQGRTDLINLGYMEADVAIKVAGGVCKLRVAHAGGGSSYATSYALQKVIESYEGGSKPSILLVGHYHKSLLMPAYRNVNAILMGTTKAQDVFMRKNKLSAHVGGWICKAWIDKRTGAVVRFRGDYIPFFDQGYYESMAFDTANDSVEFLGANETYNVVTPRTSKSA